MATSWVAELDRKEHKNWVMVGCALNITKNGITQVIQGKMEAWYQTLISSPPLRSLGPCTCVLGSPKCVRCVTWETELKRHHTSRRPVICWDNSDRTQWGSPTGAWEVAKIFMPTLGRRGTRVTDADTTDIGGLLNLLEWCPFIYPPLSRTVLSSARDQCRNHWAHASKQELQDSDVNTIFGHLNNLLNDPVFIADSVAKKSSNDLQDLFHHGLVTVRDSEVEALHLLRQSLEADLAKCQDDLADVQDKVLQLDADTKTIGEGQKVVIKVKEQGDWNREEIEKVRHEMETEVHTRRKDLTYFQDYLSSVEDKISQLDAEVKRRNEFIQRDISEVKEQGRFSREEIVNLRQQLDTEVKEIETDLNEKISKVLNAVEDFNSLLKERDDLHGAFHVISGDLEHVRSGLQRVAKELTTAKTQVANLQINLVSVKCELTGVASEVVTNKNSILDLQKDVKDVKEEVETLKVTPSEGHKSDDSDVLCAAPSRLTAFTGREAALAWLEQNLAPDQSSKNCSGTSRCTKAICGLGGCGKTSLAVELVWRCRNRFPGGMFWINGESDENVSISVVENLALLNIPASTSEKVDDTLNRFLASLSKKERPWLLVVDNADELQDSTCPTGVRKICKGPWQRNGNAFKFGHILLTTRQTVKDTKTFLKLSSDDCLELECFSEKEGALFLMQRTGINGEAFVQEAVNLSNELGSLPLALEQAAAYICALPIPCGFKDYLEKYHDVKMSLLEQQPATALSIEAQHRLSVHTTWLMNFEFVRNKSPAAATMMRIAAFLESENIPIDVINPGYPELDQEELRESARSEIDIAATVKILSSYSLVSVNHQKRVFGVHKLVQEVVRDSLTTSARIEILIAATRVLHFAFQKNREPCSELAKYVRSTNLSAIEDGSRNILVALLLNFVKLKKHFEEETTPQENSNDILLNDDILKLCTFVYNLCRNNTSLYRLSSELSDFNLRVAKKVYADENPNMLLLRMVETSTSKRNCSSLENYKEAKELSKKTVQKLVELEESGTVINADVKYQVLKHRASYYALEGKWEKNYKALLKLENLPLSSDVFIIDLQMCIGRAENFVSACNFQSVLTRYEKALELARRTYPWNHPELLRLLQFITSLLYNEHKLAEAKPYAEEMLKICKELPSSSDHHIKGMTNALSVINEYDPLKAETLLLETLEDRWPHIYHEATNGYKLGCPSTADDGSDEHLAMVLNSVMECLLVVARWRIDRNILTTRKLHFYRRIAEILQSIRKKFYGDIHPEMEGTYYNLIFVHQLLGNLKEVSRLQKVAEKCLQGESKHLYQSAPCDYNMYVARKQKDCGNNLFKARDYSGALRCYNQALSCLPNDAKLLTNRAATHFKLSKQQRSEEDERDYLALALQDSQNAIAADPSWVKAYYWKAVCLAHLGERGPSLAVAAVAKHLFPSQCAKIPAVVDRFGSYHVTVVTTILDLLYATEKRNSRNVVIVVKEGKYELPCPLNLPKNLVIVGLGEVHIFCSKGVPLQLAETTYMENISLYPTLEILKERAKKCVFDGQMNEALSLYSQALISCPNNPQILTSRASSYLKSAEQKDNPSDRKSVLELGLTDAEAAIKANPAWLLGYHTKAAILAELDRKQQALAAAAVFKHLSSGRDVPGVIQRYGDLNVLVVQSPDELCNVPERIKKLEGVNQVVLINEGEYLLESSVDIRQPIIVVGQGKVKVSSKIGSPFCFTQAGYVENVEIVEDRDDQQGAQDHVSSDSQSEVISLATPPGYEHNNNECKVN